MLWKAFFRLVNWNLLNHVNWVIRFFYHLMILILVNLVLWIPMTWNRILFRYLLTCFHLIWNKLLTHNFLLWVYLIALLWIWNKIILNWLLTLFMWVSLWLFLTFTHFHNHLLISLLSWLHLLFIFNTLIFVLTYFNVYFKFPAFICDANYLFLWTFLITFKHELCFWWDTWLLWLDRICLKYILWILLTISSTRVNHIT